MIEMYNISIFYLVIYFVHLYNIRLYLLIEDDKDGFEFNIGVTRQRKFGASVGCPLLLVALLLVGYEVEPNSCQICIERSYAGSSLFADGK